MTSGWRRLGKRPLAVLAAVAFVVVAAACLAAPLLAPYQLDAIDLANLRQPPSWKHWMGTDDLGRDVLTRILFGGRISITIGLLAALVGTGLGTMVGTVAGLFDKSIDNLLMRFTDVAYAIPTLPLLIVLSAYSAAALITMVVIIGGLSWMATARVVRAEVLTIRATPYLEAARALGAGSATLIWRHTIPNVMSPIIVGGTLAVGNAIVIESSLSFLGLGVQPPTPTWGNMLMDSQSTMASKPWLTIFPGVAILVVVLAVNYLGDALRDVTDPRRSGSDRP